MLLVNVVPQVGELSKAMGTLASRGSAGVWEQNQVKLLKLNLCSADEISKILKI